MKQDNIWQGEVEIVKQVKPPVFKVRAQWTCSYCHRLNWIYFRESELHLKPGQAIHKTCSECGAVWEIQLLLTQNISEKPTLKLDTEAQPEKEKNE